jgi:hypothetical protein
MKTNYFTGCNTLDQLKARYKELAMANHPDRGGNTQIMQQINLQYESMKKNPSLKFWKQKEEAKQDFIEFPEIINKIIGYDGIVIELCSNWLWLSGKTYKYSKQLKHIGFIWADEKKMWFWRPKDYKSANRKPRTMDYIRDKYGSDIYHKPSKKELDEKTQ